MLNRPQFKSCFRVETVAPNEVFLFDEKGKCRVLRGRLYFLIAPYLFGKVRSADEIADALQERISAAEIYYALLRLQSCDLIEEAEEGQIPSSLRAFSNLLGAVEDPRKKALSVIGLGKVPAKRYERNLRSLSLRLAPAEEGDLFVVLADNYRRKEIALLSARWEKEKKPYLLIKPRGAIAWIGPLFVPGKTGCYQCLLESLEKNEAENRYVEQKKKYEEPLLLNRAELPSSQSLALGLAANEILKWALSGENEKVEGKILCYDPFSSSFASHQLIRRPHCSTCGSPIPREFAPLVLESRRKGFVEDGGHRMLSPEETFQKYRHLISPITGIVDRLEQIDASIFPSSRFFRASHLMAVHSAIHQPRPRSVSGGKGKSEAQAKASCLCEALERYSGAFQGNEMRKRAKYRELADAAIHPNRLLLFSEKQYRERKEKISSFDWVPHPFDESLSIDWTPAWSLTEKRCKWLPTPFCYFQYPCEKPEEVFSRADSNGCAAGNNLEEAILQGFFELVERDSVALWWYPRLRRSGVDLASFPDPCIDLTVQAHRQQGREVWAIDLTTDLNISSFSAFSRKIEGNASEEILIGFGAHFDPKIALLRALIEMGQMIGFAALSGEKDQTKEGKDEAVFAWLRDARLTDHPYLLPDPNTPLKKYSSYLRFDTSDLKEDVLQCQRIVEAKGMEMVVLDQTRPEVGLSVVKVVVPGLRHFWPRFEKGRLYDVPFELGLVEKKISEEELNPLPMFA